MATQPQPQGTMAHSPIAAKRKQLIGGGIVGAIVTLLTVSTGLLSVDGIKDEFCQGRAGRQWSRDQASSDNSIKAWPGCGEGFDVITVAGAESFMRNYLGNVSGADPGTAWAMRTSEARDVTTRQDFIEKWTPSLWIELVDDPQFTKAAVIKQGNFNTFKVFSREYADVGRVTVRRSTVTLVIRGGEPRLYEEDEGRRLEAPVVDYPQARVTSKENTYQLPRSDSDPSLFSNEMSVGGTLEVLCELEKDDGWWYRTPQGWISGAAADLEAPAEFTCSQIHRDL